MNAPFTSEEALRYGWEKTKENMKPLLVIVAIFGVVQIAFKVLNNDDSNVFLNLASIIVNLFISVGVIRLGLNILDGKSKGLADFNSIPFEIYWKYAVANFLYCLMVILGFIALIIPGVYLAIKYQLVTEFIVDKNVGIAEAFNLSSEATKGFWWNWFWLMLVIGFVNVLGALALGVGLFITLPVTLIAYLYAYRKLAERGHTPLDKGIEIPVQG